MKPTAELTEEHDAIKVMLQIMEKVSQQLDAGGRVDARHLELMVDFI